MSGFERFISPAITNRQAIILALRRLHIHVQRRTFLHPEPDVTLTAEHLRNFLKFLQDTEAQLYTRNGISDLVANGDRFVVNQLYRPTKMCTQPHFERERCQAIVLWRELMNAATRALESER